MKIKWVTTGAFFITFAIVAIMAICGLGNSITAAALGGYTAHDCYKKLLIWWAARPNT